MKLKKLPLKYLILLAFFVIEAVIYAVYNVMAALNAPDPIYLKYAGILLCLAVSLVPAVMSDRTADNILLCVALLFTAVSDLFIMVLEYYEIGVITFTVAQCVYFYRLYADRLKKIYISLGVRLGVMVVLIITFAAIGKLDLLVSECIIYITMLVGNVADSFVICKRSVGNLLFAIGLLLFLGCDICVGLFNFGTVLNVELPRWLTATVPIAIWVFYLPSQVLITSTGYIKIKASNSNAVEAEGDNNVAEG